VLTAKMCQETTQHKVLPQENAKDLQKLLIRTDGCRQHFYCVCPNFAVGQNL